MKCWKPSSQKDCRACMWDGWSDCWVNRADNTIQRIPHNGREKSLMKSNLGWKVRTILQIRFTTHTLVHIISFIHSSSELDLDRYKFVVQVTIGEQRGQGVKYAYKSYILSSYALGWHAGASGTRIMTTTVSTRSWMYVPVRTGVGYVCHSSWSAQSILCRMRSDCG